MELAPRRSLAVNTVDFKALNLPMGIPIYYSSTLKDDLHFNRLGFAQDSIAGDIVRVNLFYGSGDNAIQGARKVGDTKETRVYVLLPKFAHSSQ